MSRTGEAATPATQRIQRLARTAAKRWADNHSEGLVDRIGGMEEFLFRAIHAGMREGRRLGIEEERAQIAPRIKAHRQLARAVDRLDFSFGRAQEDDVDHELQEALREVDRSRRRRRGTR